MKILFFIVLFSGLLFGIGYSQEPLLKPGMKAPPLHISSWLKGEPIANFERGRTFIVEFGSVSCPPCRKSIPLLSELAGKYSRQVTVVYVYVGDCLDTLSTICMNRIINHFQAISNKMNFTVGVEIPDLTWKEWIFAAGYAGTPVSFIINNGIIAWIGSPFALEPVLGKIINNSFNEQDMIAVKEKQHKEDSIIIAAIKLGNSQGVKMIDSLMLSSPHLSNELYFSKFILLKKYDSSTAYCLLQLMLDERLKRFDWEHLASAIQNDKKNLNYEMLIKVYDRIIEEADTQHWALTHTFLKANAYFEMGNTQKAKEVYKSALKLSKSVKNSEEIIESFQELIKQW